MARYKCKICGFIYDEEEEDSPITELKECPVCKQEVSNLLLIESDTEPTTDVSMNQDTTQIGYDNRYTRTDDSCRYMKEIHEMAVSNHTVHASMGTLLPIPGWDDILLLGAQLNPPPLDDDAPVLITTVIGRNAKRPMILAGPVYISHMSFGALSQEVKTALSKGSAMAKTAMCSGEGGILPSEIGRAHV